MRQLAEIEQEVKELQRQRYWYQSVPIDGIVTPSFNGWPESRFYNRGKWDNFITPLLPPTPEGLSFFELGCNAGLFLLFAAESGFTRVVGIEGDDDWMKHGRFILDHHRDRDAATYGRIEFIHARVGPTGFGANATCNIRTTAPELDLSAVGRTDVFLIANTLYWIERNAALRFIDELSVVARHCIVVSVEAASALGGPAIAEEVRAAFANAWNETACVARLEAVGAADDPAPRPMFSIRFTAKGV